MRHRRPADIFQKNLFQGAEPTKGMKAVGEDKPTLKGYHRQRHTTNEPRPSTIKATTLNRRDHQPPRPSTAEAINHRGHQPEKSDQGTTD